MRSSFWITLIVSAAVVAAVMMALTSRNKNLQQELAEVQGKSRSQGMRNSSPSGAPDPSEPLDPAQSQERIDRAVATIRQLIPPLNEGERVMYNSGVPGDWVRLQKATLAQSIREHEMRERGEAMPERKVLDISAFPKVLRSVAGYSFDELIAVADAIEDTPIQRWVMLLAAQEDPVRMAGDPELQAGIRSYEVMGALGRKDPAAALALLGPKNNHISLRVRLAAKMLGTDLEQGLQTFLEIHEKVASENNGRLPIGLNANLAPALPKGSLPGVIGAMNDPAYATIRPDLLKMTLAELMLEDGVTGVAQRADSMQLTPDEVKAAIKEIKKLGGLETDPAAMVEWILENGPANLPSVVWDWAELDKRAATDWLSELEPSPARDQAVANFVEEAYDIDEVGARVWLDEIQDEQYRVETMREVVRDNPTPDGIRFLLEQTPGDRQETLNGLIRGSGVLLGRNESDISFREELMGQMTAAELSAAFESLPNRQFNRAQKRIIHERFQATLEGLGHPAEEVDEMLPKWKNPKRNSDTQER